MSERSVVHDTFTMERRYDVPPERVFAAWADKALKTRWFCDHPGLTMEEFTMDFRVGGREYNRGRWEGGMVHTFDGVYRDIVENERIIYTYAMTVNGERISASVATVSFSADGDGTLMTFTEQGAFLDGLDNVEQRKEGTAALLDNLGASFEKSADTA
ncbi:MAG: SRPBCC domain-containing protein [Deltaproteobacteria bacterium]|nr:SRPBCC domain-containing protein [Deltaproteobacteria bacterium]